MGLVVISCSLFKAELLQTKTFEFFYILAIEEIDKIRVKMLKGKKGGKESKDTEKKREGNRYRFE